MESVAAAVYSRSPMSHAASATFELFPLAHGQLASDPAGEFPTSMSAWDGRRLALDSGATHFGYVLDGECELECAAGRFRAGPGMYFSVPGPATVGGAGRGLVVASHGSRGVFLLGGPIETTGRLRYIDGCTDSLLVPPLVLGDPCLNALYFPPGVDQTEHTHPSLRAGIVSSGRGECVLAGGAVALEPGLAFVIRAGCAHRFRTTGTPMVVIAFHPDSDFGPTHEAHPMINRTIVDGVPASRIDAIRTRE